MLIVTIVSVAVAALSCVVAWRSLHRERLRSVARVAALGTAIDRDSEGSDAFSWETPPDSTVHTLVIGTTRPTFKPRGPLLTASIGVVAGVVLIVFMAMLADRDRAPAAAAAPESLELLSMTHSREGSALIVTGLVRNPSTGETAPLTTIVTALDRDGQVVGSGTASLAAVAPGRTLPFYVRIDNITSLGRYRVSFRANGTVMPHVDRRGTRAAAGVATE